MSAPLTSLLFILMIDLDQEVFRHSNSMFDVGENQTLNIALKASTSPMPLDASGFDPSERTG